MSARDAFTAGVKPGGLTSSTEIRLLLCYLVKVAGPITRQALEDALLEEQLVNYFEIGSCLDDIERQQLVTCTDSTYAITDKGCGVISELEYDLPRSVREVAVTAALRAQRWAQKEASYDARITQRADGRFRVRCRIRGLSADAFQLDLIMPDRPTAELVKKRFVLRGSEVYELLINKLSED